MHTHRTPAKALHFVSGAMGLLALAGGLRC
jgi:hypothetical protein